MNSLAVLALLVAAVSAAPKAPCPKTLSLLDIPDHQLSHVFYRCANGRPIRFECPSGLVYNRFRGVCDFPRGYRAEETTSSPATVTSISTTPTTIVDGSTPSTTAAPTFSTRSSTVGGTPSTTSPVTVSTPTTSTVTPGVTPSTTAAPTAGPTASTTSTLTPPTGTTTSPATVAARHFRSRHLKRILF